MARSAKEQLKQIIDELSEDEAQDLLQNLNIMNNRVETASKEQVDIVYRDIKSRFESAFQELSHR